MEKTQFNVRVPPKIKDVAVQVADALDWMRDEIAEAAYVALFGTKDEVLNAKVRKAQKTAKRLKLTLSFEWPEFLATGMQN